MKAELNDNAEVKKIDELISPLAMKCVEFNERKVSSYTDMSVFVCRSDGAVVSTDDLEKSYNVLYPYFEMMRGTKNLNLEVSSPGLERKIKDACEFEIFKGSSVRIFDEEKSDWMIGVISECSSESVKIESEGRTHEVLFEKIKKANLLMEEKREK